MSSCLFQAVPLQGPPKRDRPRALLSRPIRQPFAEWAPQGPAAEPALLPPGPADATGPRLSGPRPAGPAPPVTPGPPACGSPSREDPGGPLLPGRGVSTSALLSQKAETLTVLPKAALAAELLDIHVHGLGPGERGTLRAPAVSTAAAPSTRGRATRRAAWGVGPGRGPGAGGRARGGPFTGVEPMGLRGASRRPARRIPASTRCRGA